MEERLVAEDGAALPTGPELAGTGAVDSKVSGPAEGMVKLSLNTREGGCRDRDFCDRGVER